MDEGLPGRIIGHYRGTEPGPLVVAIGGIHGNEPAGVRALERLFELLEEEPRINPGFTFRGELLALRGNLEALALGKRFIDIDLNRIWNPPPANGKVPSTSEHRELHELIACVEHAIEEAPLSELVFIDLHTTTVSGGVFVATGNDTASISLATEMAIPVVRGLMDGLHGTTLHYFQEGNFASAQPARAIAFEAGGHLDPISIGLSLAATLNLLRALGCVREEDVATYHDEILREAAAELPPVTTLAYIHHLRGGDQFRMRPGYGNFHPVIAGEVVAQDRHGDITARTDGFLLMPLYQDQGNEGFFLLKSYP